MRAILLVLTLALMAAIGAGFYFGLLTIAAGQQDQSYFVTVAAHPAVMVPTPIDSRASASEINLDAKGRITDIRPEKNEFVLTESFRDLLFQVDNSASIQINGKASKLADLRSGDDATVIYTKHGQMLLGNTVNATRAKLD